MVRKNTIQILKIIPGYFLSILLLSTAVSCENNDAGDFVKYAETTTRYVRSENIAVGLFVLFHQTINDTNLINNGTAVIDSALVVFSLNLADSSAVLSFDYGNDGKISPDGKLRKGQIFASWERPYDHSEVALLASTQNYSVDDWTTEGTFFYHNTGETVSGKIVFEINLNLLFYQNGLKISDLHSSRTMFWESGFDEPEKTINHVFSFPVSMVTEGTFFQLSGFPVTEMAFTTTFTSDFFIRFSCKNPINKGDFSITLFQDGITPLHLSGEVIDADLDGCADKVFIVNEDNFGYPIYF